MKEKKEKTPKGKVTIKAIDAINAYKIANNSKLTKMESSERYALILAIRELKKVKEEYDGVQKDALEKLKPEGMDEILGKISREERLTLDEAIAYSKFDKEIGDIMTPAGEKMVELTFEPLGKEAMEHLVESNDFVTGQIILLEDVLA